MRLFSEKLLLRVFILVGFTIAALYFVEALVSDRNLILNQTRETLFHVSVAAEDKLQGRTFHDLLSEAKMDFYPRDYQLNYLHKQLQPLAETLSINGVSVAFYDAERDSVLAYGQAKLTKDEIVKPLPPDHPSRNVLNTKLSSFQFVESPWRGPCYLLTVPLIKNGHLFGLLGVSIPEDMVKSKIRENSMQHLKWASISVSVWILLLVLFYYSRQLALQRYSLKPGTELLKFDDDEMTDLLDHSGNIPPSIRPFLESTSMYRQLVKRVLDHSSSGVAILNDKREFVYLNPKLQELTGYTVQELNELPIQKRCLLYQPQAGSPTLSGLLYSEAPMEIQAEYILHTKLHSSIPVELRAFNMLSKDRLEGIVISIYDLRDYHQFRRLQTQTALLLEALNEGVLILHENGTIAYMNHAFERILSISRSEWVGRQIFESSMEESVCEDLRLVLSGRSSRAHAMPKEFLNRQMSHFSLDVLSLVNPHSTMKGALLIGRDLSTEWQWSELSKRTDLVQSLSQMAASMAHEVRNPLTSIKGFLQLLSKGQPDPDKLQMYVQVMMEELERAHGIITEYLNLSRKNLDTQQPTSLLKLLDDIRILMESEAVLRGVNLHFYLTDETILCDQTKIKQVIINLVRNALEATARGGSVTVSIRISQAERTVVIQVADTGCGIADETLPHIFTPFYTTKKGGTGLGLPVCKQIIEEHGGTIQASSKEGEGSTFTIHLPLPHTKGSDGQVPLPHLDAPA
ncbi:PAS domain-containing sensor histidine kinase [Effusibacillus consociatus]|uniref:histidine kinase n=1 Tax=Effusibacillus consociatus TaxID=1117041 RepID=A0ABV9Q2G1_9BACL